MNTKKKKKLTDTINEKRFTKWFWIIFCAPFALIILLLLMISVGIFGKLPTFDELESPKNNLASEIIAENGEQLGSFFIQNRSYVSYDELSPYLVAALVSTEDQRYYSHSGIDFISLARVGVKTLAMGNRKQGGGSTITQQLAKNLYPRNTTIYTNVVSRTAAVGISKLKEWITAVMLEYNYTKEEIIAMYLNTVFYGSNAYGIKSASTTFFNKQPHEINAEEAAMLVGVVNAPSAYNPVRNYDRALKRRNTVISRMKDQGYITRHERDSLYEVPIKIDYHPVSHNEGTGTYFREMLRLVMTAPRPKRGVYQSAWDYEKELKEWDENPLYGWCHKNVKADGTPYDLYRDGLKIYTTINISMQKYAEEALIEHMTKSVQPSMDAQVKRSKVLFNSVDKQGVERIMTNAMRNSDRYREMRNEGISDEEIKMSFTQKVDMSIFTYKGEVDTLMTPRDSIMHYKRYMRASFMAMDPTNGQIKAYVGGPDFRYFKYDMVKQGKRQVGSTIKPFVYTFAIDHLGLNPCTPVPNLPVSIETTDGDAWTPKEASKVVYDGKMKPLKWGLANSRNNYSAWIMKQAKQPAAVADFIYKLGIKSYIDPVFALCLGTSDFSLFEMVGAYSAYANRGVHSDPMFVTRIEDRQGNQLSTFSTKSFDAISEQTAYTMLNMLKNVVNAGTAGRLRWAYGITGEVGGKTGTSQNSSDAWFMGVTPKLVGGTWVGGEDRSVHLYSGGEGSAVALPIFGIFMQKVYADPNLNIKPTDTFPQPVGAVKYDCDDGSDDANNAVSDANAEDEFFD